MPDTESTGEINSWLGRMVVGRRPARTLGRIVVFLVLCFVLFRYILIPIQVTGISMEPTYHDGKVNFVNRLAYWRHEPRRGDVVGIRIPGYRVMFLKRVIALPGESISIRDGIVFINGKPLAEPYAKSNRWNMNEVILGPTEYYYIGDNRSMSLRDHEHRAADRSRIAGKVLY
jgi:signal peptidase I